MFGYRHKGGALIEIEPGDATRYVFTAVEADYATLYVAGKPRLSLYEYNSDSILAAHTRLGDMPIGSEEALNDHYVRYIVEHSNCNPHTARAMVHAVAMMLLDRHGMIDHNKVNEQIREH